MASTQGSKTGAAKSSQRAAVKSTLSRQGASSKSVKGNGAGAKRAKPARPASRASSLRRSKSETRKPGKRAATPAPTDVGKAVRDSEAAFAEATLASSRLNKKVAEDVDKAAKKAADRASKDLDKSIERAGKNMKEAAEGVENLLDAQREGYAAFLATALATTQGLEKLSDRLLDLNDRFGQVNSDYVDALFSARDSESVAKANEKFMRGAYDLAVEECAQTAETVFRIVQDSVDPASTHFSFMMERLRVSATPD